jgi:hypothetical protein
MLWVKTKMAARNFEVHTGKKLELSRSRLRGAVTQLFAPFGKSIVAKCKYILLYFSELNSCVP